MSLKLITSLFCLLAFTLEADAWLRRGTPSVPSEPDFDFFFSTTGSDTGNNCTVEATPCQTISKLNGLSYAAGSRIGLKGGDSFTGCISFTSANVPSSSAGSPVVLGSYGTGYATLTCNTGSTTTRTAAIKITNLHGITIQDLILRSTSETVAIGVWITNTGTSVEYQNITVQRNDFQGFYSTALSSGATLGGHVYIDAQSSNGWDGIQVYENIMHGASVTSKDLAGIASASGAGAIIQNVHYRGNHVWNMGTQNVVNNHASGILMNSVNGGTAEYNLAHDIGATWNQCGGPVGIWAHNTTSVTIQYNEAYQVRPTTYTGGCDWNGLGFDGAAGATHNSILQYNYSHDNGGSGIYHWGAATTGVNGNIIRFNFTANNNTNEVTAHGEFSFNGQNNQETGLVFVHDNEFYATASASSQGGCLAFQGIAGGMPASGSEFHNNICSADSGAFSLGKVAHGNQNTLANLGQVDFAGNVWNTRSGTFNVSSWGGGGVGEQYSTYAAWAAVTGETGGSHTTGGSIPAGPAFGMLGVDTGTVPHIALSAQTVNDSAAQGTDIGTLSIVNSPGGTYTCNVDTNSAMRRVQTNGMVLEVGSTALSASNMALMLVRVDCTNGTTPLFRYFVITVT